MSSGADLFVVCKSCGAEVSPYITECPYCGKRLRRRAPKLPRDGAESPRRGRRTPALGRLRRGEIPGIRADAAPYGTALLIALAAGVWVAWNGGYVTLDKLVVAGPLSGDWWKLLSSEFTYTSGIYAFAALLAIGIFGMLLERRHGPLVVIMLFLLCGVTGSLAALAVYSDPVVSGGNAAALGLIAAWSAPDLLDRRAGRRYDGDLLGAAFVALVLLAMPLARTEVNELAGVTGGLVGLVVGLGLAQMHPA
jgi:membrane associated rhomboid family serine protease